MYTLPIQLNVKNKNVLVIGGGEIGTRKVEQLLPYKPIITIVSPVITMTLLTYVQEAKVKWIQRKVRKEDMEGTFLIILTTNEDQLYEQIQQWKNENQLLNNAVSMEKSDFHIPGIIQRGDLCVSVSTNGASPSLTKKIKYDLLEQYDERFEEYVDFLKESRKRIFESKSSKEERRKVLTTLVTEEWLTFSKEERERRLNQLLK